MREKSLSKRTEGVRKGWDELSLENENGGTVGKLVVALIYNPILRIEINVRKESMFRACLRGSEDEQA